MAGGTKIVFAENSYGSELHEIYVVGLDGIDKFITQGMDPDWSSDGKKIAFNDTQDGKTNIYVVNADGTGSTQLTKNLGDYNISPDWSPDGHRIVFASERNGNTFIYIMDADGSNVNQITR